MLEKTDLSENKKVYIGIDPGWNNLGFAISSMDETGKVSKELTITHCPSAFSNINEYIKSVNSLLKNLNITPSYVTIERYVAYKDVYTAESENINILIGALYYYFGSTYNLVPKLIRAIDWKMALVKALFKKKGFENPSTSLDKKFSFAAATAVIDYDEPDKIEKLDTDHAADALCLSAIPIYVK